MTAIIPAPAPGIATFSVDRSAPLTNATIQEAVDRAAEAGGGIVRVPAGLYLMHDALHLRTGVRVIGEKGTVLRNVPSVVSKIPNYIGYGHFEFSVAEPEKFKVGMGVHILDDGAVGFYTTVATIIERRGDQFIINRPFSHDYHTANNGRVISVHSIVEGENVHDASLEDITLDGDLEHEKHNLNGCRGGGIFLIGCGRVSLRRVEVTRYKGDAISFQQCHDILVDSCHVHHNAGGGIHPGSGTVRYVMRGNSSHDNGGFGIFYCLRTTHSICTGNDIRNNGQAGISIGERDTDHYIAHNTIAGNAKAGVDFRVPVHTSGDRVVLRANAIGPNCRLEGQHEIEIPAGLHDVHILDNLLTPTRGAIGLAKGCERVSIHHNLVNGRPQELEHIAADPELAADAQIALPLPKIHPSDLPLNGAAHLRIARLEPWVDLE
ncbi:MAG: right-handed parallel beta-helix repeat-containing protein [Planctomycetota bacterium]|nr:right-handed parallel beta-helix repeat-containing protein [Planctomycetota bacterium]